MVAMVRGGLAADTLFVGVTRPAMRWGVSYPALLFNLVFTMEVFLGSRNLLALLLAVPVHGVAALLCARDPRFFDLLLLWLRVRLPALWGNSRFWRAASYGPLRLPGGRDRYSPALLVGTVRTGAGVAGRSGA